MQKLLQSESIYSKIMSRKMLICIFTGFSSGLPFYVLVSLLPLWLKFEQVDIKSIGLFLLTGLPYTWKFLWAPFLDRYIPSFFGRRRGWMLLSQLPLLIFLFSFGFLDPRSQSGLLFIAAMATLIAFFSATQDIVLDAFRREILSDNELGLGNSIHVNGYRIAGLIPGSLSLILADHYAWTTVFMITALFMLPGILMTVFIAKEPHYTPPPQSYSLYKMVLLPLQEFFQRKGIGSAIGVLLFIFLYKFGDSMATALISVFYADMGFTKTHIGVVVKNASLWSMIISSILGGIIMLKIGINRALWLFGLVQITTILGFVYLASEGPFESVGMHELILLGGVVSAEYIGVGLGTVAFVAFMARETNPLYTATQLALFTSLSALPRTLFNAQAGKIIEMFGYYHYFWFCFCIAIPGMLCLFWIAPWRVKKKMPI